jgi:hypothetical protein
MNKKDFSNYVKDITNGEYSVKGIISESKKFLIHHSNCNKDYPVYAYLFKSGRRCPYCNGGVRYTKDDFIKKVFERVGNEYSVLGEYKNSLTKIKMKHNTCGNDYEVRPANFLAKGDGLSNRCPVCFRNYRKTTDQFKREVYNLVKDEYKVLGNYKNNKSKIKFIHNNCGRKFEMRPRDFLKNNGNRCPLCKKSKGENFISEWLTKNNIQFQHPYKDKRCKNKNILEFDFKIFNKDTSFTLLEYDGRLHFETWKDGNKHQKHLNKQLENDNIKNKFCKENNIKLIRINYLENIKERLKKEFLTSTTIENTSKDKSE